MISLIVMAKNAKQDRPKDRITRILHGSSRKPMERMMSDQLQVVYKSIFITLV